MKKVTKKAFPGCLGLRPPGLGTIDYEPLIKSIPGLAFPGVLCTSKFAPCEFVIGVIPARHTGAKHLTSLPSFLSANLFRYSIKKKDINGIVRLVPYPDNMAKAAYFWVDILKGVNVLKRMEIK